LKDKQAYILFYAQSGEASKQNKNVVQGIASLKQYQNRFGDSVTHPRFDKALVKRNIGKFQPAMRLPYPESLQLLKPDDTLKNTAKTAKHPKNKSPLSKVHPTAVVASVDQPPEVDHAQLIQDTPPPRPPIKRKRGRASMGHRQTRTAKKKKHKKMGDSWVKFVSKNSCRYQLFQILLSGEHYAMVEM